MRQTRWSVHACDTARQQRKTERKIMQIKSILAAAAIALAATVGSASAADQDRPSEGDGFVRNETIRQAVALVGHPEVNAHPRFQRKPASSSSARTFAAGTPRLDPPNSGSMAALTATTSPFMSSTGPPLPPWVVSAS